MSLLVPLPVSNRFVFVAGFLTLAVVANFISVGRLGAQERSSDQTAKWIAGLGAKDYLTRMKSEEEILGIGCSAIEAVTKATQSPDIEVSIRAGRLLTQLLAQDFDRRKEKFLAAKYTVSATSDFPQWRSFSKLAGSSLASKKLFVAIIEHRRQKPQRRRSTESSEYLGYLSDDLEPYTPLPSTVVEIADELFYQLAIDRPKISSVDQGVIVEQLSLSGFEANLPKTMVKSVVESQYADEIGELISAWIVQKKGDQLLTHNQIEIIYRFGLTGFMSDLVDVLGAENSKRRIPAAEAIAKVGGSDAVKVLAGFVSGDEVVVMHAQPDLKVSLPITIGDVAFQLILQIQKTPLKDFGLLSTAGTMVFTESPIFGFADRNSASAAIGRWQSSRR